MSMLRNYHNHKLQTTTWHREEELFNHHETPGRQLSKAIISLLKPKHYYAWSCQNVYEALNFLLDNILIRFGTKLYIQVYGIPMGTYCAPLVADLFLYCYERNFMMSLSDDKQADVIDAFNTTSGYLDDILNINNVYLTIW